MDAKKVTAGEPLANSPLRSARVVNGLVDLLARAQSGGRADGGAAPRGARLPAPQWVRVRNEGVTDRPRGACVQLGDYLLDELDHRNLWFAADVPAAPAERRWAILGAPLKAGEIGVAYVTGVCVALVDVADTGHGFARPEAGRVALVSASEGPIEILSPLASSGEQYLAVRLGAATGGGTGSSDCHSIAGVDLLTQFEAIPAAPATGAYALLAIEGCLYWVPVGCDVPVASS